MANTVGDINVEIGARLNKLDKAVSEVNKKLGSINKGQRQVAAGSSSLEKSFSKLGRNIAAAFTVREIAEFGMEAVKLAGQLQGVQAGFDRLGGTPELMNELTRATRGTVSELQLMQSAVRAGNFGIELQPLPDLLEFASRRAQETGEDVDYLVQSIVTGIGRKSPLILDNLGISASMLRDELQGLSFEAASIGQVSEAVGRIAERELTKMGEVTVTTTDKIAQASAEFENMQTAIGQRLSGAVENAAGNFASLFSTIADFFDNTDPAQEYKDQEIQLRTLQRAVMDSTKTETERKAAVEQIQRLYPQYLSNIDTEKMSYEELDKAIDNANQRLREKGELSSFTKDIQDAQKAVDELNEEISTYNSRTERRVTLVEQASGIEKDAAETNLEYAKRIRESNEASAEAQRLAAGIIVNTDIVSRKTQELAQAEAALNEIQGQRNRTAERLNLNMADEASATENATTVAQGYADMLRNGSINAEGLRQVIEAQREALANLDTTQEGAIVTHEQLYENVNALTKVLTDYEASQNTAAQGTTVTTEAVEEQISAVDRLFNRLQATDAILNNFKSGESIGVDFDAVAADISEDEFLPNFEPLAGWDKTAEDIMNFKKQVQELSPVLANMFNLSDEAATKLAKNLDMTASQFKNTYNSAMGLAMAVQGALMNAFQNGGNVGEAMIEFLKNLVFRLAAAAAAAAVLAAIMSTITGGVTSFSSVFKSGFGNMSQLGGLLGLDGARAAGGPVKSGGSYLVGENGPEIFTPSMSGMILPNSALSAPSIPSMNPTGNVSGQMVVTVVGEISGDNIRLVQENSTQRNNRAQRG